jgi:hypothetical protein
MKAVILAVAVLAFVSCTTAGQRKPIQALAVTRELVASQPAGRLYVILPRSGAIYDVAPGIDYSRVRVGTSLKDNMPVDQYVSGLGLKFVGQEFLFGSLNDLVGVLPPDDGGGGSEAACPSGSGICTCIGRKDCSDLSKKGVCKSGPNDAACGKGFGGGSRWGCTCQKK